MKDSIDLTNFGNNLMLGTNLLKKLVLYEIESINNFWQTVVAVSYKQRVFWTIWKPKL